MRDKSKLGRVAVIGTRLPSPPSGLSSTSGRAEVLVNNAGIMLLGPFSTDHL